MRCPCLRHASPWPSQSLLIEAVHSYEPVSEAGRQYSRSITVPLRKPSCDSAALTSTAVRGMRAIFPAWLQLRQAGVMLLDLQDHAVEQAELALDDPGTGSCPTDGGP